jgi:tetratricopeptide (TPR) repeat protein
MSYYLEDYVETIIIFLDEDKNTFKKYVKNKDKRLEKLATGPQNSPYFLYTQAEINLHWAIARVKFGERITSVKEASSAYKMLIKNSKKFPDFIANKKTISTLRAIFGAVPPEYRWATNFLTGIDGNTEQGRKDLEDVVNYSKNNTFVFDDETHIIYAFTLLLLGNQGEEAWNVIKNSHLKPDKSILAALAVANVGMKSGHSAEVIQILQNAPKGKNYYKVPLMDFYQGVAKISLLEDDAKQYLVSFVNNAKGKTAIKEAYQKLAWYELIHDNESGYWANMKLCKLKGATESEGDKAAFREANSGQKPESNLLKARLLFDGGQYERALQTLSKKTNVDFAYNRAYALEFTYRLARINHKLNRLSEAANYYQQTINDGKTEEYVFACNAAFQLGSIYEQQGNFTQAKNYYNLCLTINPSEYASSVHQKAKAGLNRIQ